MTISPFVGPTVQMEAPSQHRHPRPGITERTVWTILRFFVVAAFVLGTVAMPAPPTPDRLFQSWALIRSGDGLAAWDLLCRPTRHMLVCATALQRLTS